MARLARVVVLGSKGRQRDRRRAWRAVLGGLHHESGSSGLFGVAKPTQFPGQCALGQVKGELDGKRLEIGHGGGLCARRQGGSTPPKL